MSTNIYLPSKEALKYYTKISEGYLDHIDMPEIRDELFNHNISMSPISTGTEEFKCLMLEYYGVEHNMMIPEVVEKANESRKNTMKAKYGIEHNTHIKEVKKQQVKTWKKNCLEKTGYDHYNKTPEAKQKMSIRRKKEIQEKLNRPEVTLIREYIKKYKIKLGQGWPQRNDEQLKEIIQQYDIR